MISILMTAKTDAQVFESGTGSRKGINASAGVRVRKALMDVRNKAQAARVEVQQIKNRS
jgi:hypothetical protein